MDYESKYQITLQGQPCTLTQSQIEFDSPNYFTACFLGEFREAQTHTLELNRDPKLFAIISTYLCGYGVLPLKTSTIESLQMSPTAALLNLRADAAFYQLGGLVDACDRLIQLEGIRDPMKSRFLIVGAEFPISYDADISTSDPPVDPPADAAVFQTYIAEDKLQEEPLKSMKTPGSTQGFEGIRMAAAMESFIARSIKGYDPHRYRLVGWDVKGQGREYHTDWNLLVVVEDLGTAETFGGI